MSSARTRNSRAAARGEQALRIQHGRRQSRPRGARRRSACPAGAQRRRQDHDGRDVRGLRAPGRRHHRGARAGPDRRQRPPARPHRGHAAGRRRLPRGARGRDAQPGRLLRRRPAGPGVAAGHPGPHRCRPHHLPTALRRAAAAARTGLRAGRPPRTGVPRRTDRGHGRARPAAGLGTDRRAAPRRRDGGADHSPTQGGRGARRPAGHHRPRRDGGRRHTGRVDARRRQGRVAVHRAAAARSVPVGRRTAGGLPGQRGDAGRIPGRGPGGPAGAGHRHGVVRTNRRAGHRHARRAAQPRGRVPRPHRRGSCGSDRIEYLPRGNLHPRPAAQRRAADAGRAIRPGAQAAAAQRRAVAADHVHPDHAAGRADAAAASARSATTAPPRSSRSSWPSR